MAYAEYENESEQLAHGWRDWRFVVILAGAALILVSFALPFYTQRLTRAAVSFSDGTTIVSFYDTLVRDLNLAMSKRPLDAQLVGVAAELAPVSHAPSAYGWMAAIAQRPSSLRRLLSLLLCLAVPLLSAGAGIALVVRSQRAPAGLARAWVPAAINLSWAALLGLFLAWCQQFDFSFALQQQHAAEFAPGVGVWGAALGAVLVLAGAFAFWRALHEGVLDWWALVFAVALTIWLLIRFKPFPYLEIWAFVEDGILVTLRIVATSFGFILLVSLLGGLGRISRSRVIYFISSLYVELIRGIPLLVQLLFIWYALPQVFDMLGNVLISISPSLQAQGQFLIDLRLSPFTAAVFGLTFCYGAYGSEIFRAGISSIHRGQMEAARSLGMNYFQAMRHVILPQAVRVILPPIGNEFVALLKDSSLVSVLAVSDLTRRGREYMARTFLSFDTWIMVALCYLVLTLFSSRAVEFIESKTRFER
ncbi:MAG: amino acid ABC transporter permease [Anaerolineae bacterium]|jgi:polar amino acid transport system permease protein